MVSTASLRDNNGPDCAKVSMDNSTEEGGRRVEGKPELHVFLLLYFISSPVFVGVVLGLLGRQTRGSL